MPLALSLTGFDSTNPIPGIYAEVRFAQGTAAGDLSTKKVLLVGSKTSAGSATADTQIVGPLSDEAEFVTYFGAGSPLHRMGREYLRLHKGAALYAIAEATPAGTAATDEVTISGSPTGSGVVRFTICGEACEAAFTTSSTATTIAAAMVIAINAKTHLPVTASNVNGVVTVVAKAAGVVYNSIRFRAEATAGKGVSVTVTADTALGASGAGAAAIGTGASSYTNVLATILSTKFNYIVVHSQVSAAIDAVGDQVDLQADPSTGFRQKLIAAGALTPAAAVTLASGMNAARRRFFNQEESPEEHYVLAAKCAAAVAKNEISDPSFNFDGYGTKTGQVFPVLRPYNDSAKPTTAELTTMLNGGVTPIAVADNDQCYIVRSITTSCRNGSNYDFRARDSVVVAVGDRYTDDLVAKLASQPWTKITADPPDGGQEPPSVFCTPRRAKSVVEQHVSDYVSFGWLDPGEKTTILESLQTGVDPQVPTRMNISNPIYSAKMLHQTAVLVKESSPSA